MTESSGPGGGVSFAASAETCGRRGSLNNDTVAVADGVNILDELRLACASVAERARHVRINHDAIPDYAAGLRPQVRPSPNDTPQAAAARTRRAFWITLDAINFGSGWFPTLKKRPGRSGYFTIAAALGERFDPTGPWSAESLPASPARRWPTPRPGPRSRVDATLRPLAERPRPPPGRRHAVASTHSSTQRMAPRSRSSSTLAGGTASADVLDYEASSSRSSNAPR